MILCYHLLELSVSPINWHLSRHCGVCGLFGCFVWFVCFVFVCFCVFVFWLFLVLCFVPFCVLVMTCNREQDYVSVLHQLTFDATLQQTAYA